MAEWRPVLSLDGAYEVSADGRVRRALRGKSTFVGRPLRPRVNTRGYLQVCASIGGRHVTQAVHVLVAEAFLGPRPHAADVNHIDGVKTNNAIDNLEYVTRAENCRHAIRLWLTWHSNASSTRRLARSGSVAPAENKNGSKPSLAPTQQESLP